MMKILFKFRSTEWTHLWKNFTHFLYTSWVPLVCAHRYFQNYITDLLVMSVHSKTIFSYVHVTLQSNHDFSPHNLDNSYCLHKASLFHLYGDKGVSDMEDSGDAGNGAGPGKLLYTRTVLYTGLVLYCTLKHCCGTVYWRVTIHWNGTEH